MILVNRFLTLIVVSLLCVSCSRAREYEYKLMSYLPWTKAYSERVGFEEYVETAGGKVVHGNPEPPMPDMDKNNSTLLGIDSDDDGLRDDVEVLINYMMRNESYNQITAIRMLARSDRKVLKNHKEGSGVIEVFVDRGGDDYMCLGGFYENGEILREFASRLRYRQLNTDLRGKARENAYRKIAGHIQTWDVGVDSDKYCRFQLK